MLSASRKSCSSSTKMNSASLSTKRRISHGHATRSTLMFFLVIHFIFLLLKHVLWMAGLTRSTDSVVEPIHHLHTSAQNLFIREAFPVPSFQNAMYAKGFGPSKALVLQVRIVDRLRHKS